MPWIKMIPPQHATDELRRVYNEIYDLYPGEYKKSVPALMNPDGSEDSITAAHSLIPEAMRHIMSAYGVLLQPDLPLTRRQHELIASVVSLQNHCFY
ncbi:MAG: hypothetical protein KGS46_02610 [Chloroflexi bacterium]|jgi:hypothetical protein|nr:hypothetical protein [Chloroflexota bacterium]